MDLSEKVVVVTGAAAGIGAAIVELFLQSGARIIAVDIDPQLQGGSRTLKRNIQVAHAV